MSNLDVIPVRAAARSWLVDILFLASGSGGSSFCFRFCPRRTGEASERRLVAALVLAAALIVVLFTDFLSDVERGEVHRTWFRHPLDVCFITLITDREPRAKVVRSSPRQCKEGIQSLFVYFCFVSYSIEQVVYRRGINRSIRSHVNKKPPPGDGS